MERGDIALVVLCVAFAAFVIATLSRQRKNAARFRAEGAIAHAYADKERRFELVVPEGPSVDVYLRYVIRARSRSGGGISYGMIARLDIERREVVDAPAGQETFQHHREYLFGGAQRAFGEVPLGRALAAGPLHRMGKRVSRGVFLVRIPAGGELRLSGHHEVTGGADGEAFQIFLKPPMS